MQGKPLLEHLFLSCKGIGAKQLQKHQSKISSGGESGQSRSRVIVCVQLVTHHSPSHKCCSLLNASTPTFAIKFCQRILTLSMNMTTYDSCLLMCQSIFITYLVLLKPPLGILTFKIHRGFKCRGISQYKILAQPNN